jgi:hypothetical protein
VNILDFGLSKALEGDNNDLGAGSELSRSPTLSRHAAQQKSFSILLP